MRIHCIVTAEMPVHLPTSSTASCECERYCKCQTSAHCVSACVPRRRPIHRGCRLVARRTGVGNVVLAKVGLADRNVPFTPDLLLGKLCASKEKVSERHFLIQLRFLFYLVSSTIFCRVCSFHISTPTLLKKS